MRKVLSILSAIALSPLLLFVWGAGALGFAIHYAKRNRLAALFLGVFTVGGIVVICNAASGAPGYTPGGGATANLTLPLSVANGGTAASSASITAFNNITGYSAAGATGTTSTNLVFSTSAALTTPSIAGDTINATIQHLTLNAQSGSGYTLVLGDDYKLITLSNAGAQTINIPTNANVAFPVGTQITVIQIGAGQWTIAATTPGTTTVLSNGGTAASPKLRVQYSSATLIKVATDTWYVVGDIS